MVDAIVEYDPILDIPNLPRRPHRLAVREVGMMKGLFHLDPTLYAASGVTLYLHLLYQLADPKLARWIVRNRKTLVRVIALCDPGRLGKVVSIARNHDIDVQQHPQLREEYRAWRDRYDAAAAAAASQPRTMQQALTLWRHHATAGQANIVAANQVKNTNNLPDIPDLEVIELDGNTVVTPPSIDLLYEACHNLIHARRRSRTP
jgi:hypothetical protein